MAHFISDHTPMDDYKKMQSQMAYYIENADEFHRVPYDNRKNLNKSSVYKTIFKAMKILLIISGLSLPAAIITVRLYSKHRDENILRITSVCFVLMVLGAFVTALILGIIGAYMESHNEKKDVNIKALQESETWVLQNGYVVVAVRTKGRGGQMVKRYIMDKNNIVDVPFSCMDIIYNVHSVHNKKGKITADADASEFYIKHPYVNEIPEDNISHYFHYYNRRIRKKISWNNNMPGTQKLLDALNMLKK
ncbi:MAG: hypothetical protein ACI4EW_05015 [Butyrivibrio sp.]